MHWNHYQTKCFLALLADDHAQEVIGSNNCKSCLEKVTRRETKAVYAFSTGLTEDPF